MAHCTPNHLWRASYYIEGGLSLVFGQCDAIMWPVTEIQGCTYTIVLPGYLPHYQGVAVAPTWVFHTLPILLRPGSLAAKKQKG